MDSALIERFVFDYEKLLLTTFDSSSYEINSNALILRKFLLDSVNLQIFHQFFNPKEKFYLNDIKFNNSLFTHEYLKNLRVYIPMLVSLHPEIQIDNYTVLNKSFFLKSGKAKKPNAIISPIYITFTRLNDFISKNSIVIDGMYFNKKDIIEYASYVLGVVHNGAIPKKLERLKEIKKLSFDIATGHQNQDGIVIFGPTFSNNEVKLKFKPHNFLALGNKHEFHTLMILEYSNWIVSSKLVQDLYIKSKEHLIKNERKFFSFKSTNFFSSPQRIFDPIKY